MNDPFWNQVLSSDDDVRNDGAGPSSAGGHTSSGADGGGDDGGDDSGDSFFSADGGDDGGTNGGDDGGAGGDDGGDPGPSEIPRDPSKGKQPITEECISDDSVSDIGRSDVLESPKVIEAEDDVINSLPEAYPGPEFHASDLGALF
ncbi:hypothetical protein CJ030_MR1G007875 [Morella rubra]|uniref:Uncharacterized protein n=1 Tax=Morella rubra TaxID=262757 RepID=A0A6A1WN82_9ROSI|nr:hypothetical protein CJ030_MR1G007875 [Morella rubra]